MRKDEAGNPCPETLGEYRDFCVILGRGEANPAVRFLDLKIAENGPQAKVLITDLQMRQMLMPLLRHEK
jgi:hypothetical protein